MCIISVIESPISIWELLFSFHIPIHIQVGNFPTQFLYTMFFSLYVLFKILKIIISMPVGLFNKKNLINSAWITWPYSDANKYKLFCKRWANMICPHLRISF